MIFTTGMAAGLLFQVVIVPPLLVITVILYSKKKAPYLKYRAPLFLFIQNLGAIVYISMGSLYLMMRPTLSCLFWMWSCYIAVGFVYIPLVIRSWVFFFCCHASQHRARLPLFPISLDSTVTRNSPSPSTQSDRSPTMSGENSLRIVTHPQSISGMPETKESPEKKRGMSDWLVEHRRFVSNQFLIKVYCLGLGLLMIVPVLISILYATNPDQKFKSQFYVETFGSCHLHMSGQFGYLIAGGGYIAIIFLLNFILATSNDSYYIKSELCASTISLSIMSGVWGIWQIPPIREYNEVFPSDIFLLLGISICLSISSFWLYYRIIQAEQNFIISFHNFDELMKDKDFVERFREFLSRQLCVENLLFYEAIQEYKKSTHLCRDAMIIYNEFLENHAANAINISFKCMFNIETILNNRQQVKGSTLRRASLGKKNFPGIDLEDEITPPIGHSLFDDALHEVVSLLQLHSLPLFLQREKEARDRLVATNSDVHN